MSKLIPFLVLFLANNSYAQGLLGTGLEISVSGDMVYDQGINSTSEAEEKLTMRGAEFMLYAPIDYQFDGILTAAAHDEAGETIFELHELFIGSSRIIPRSNIRVGQFFLGVGRINRFHQHDWPFTRAPKVHRTFFDDEGVFDTGIEYNYLFDTEDPVNLTVGVTSGHRYGHAHTAGSKPKSPTHYTRLSRFFPLGTINGFEAGLNYLGRTDGDDNRLTLAGIDMTAKWRRARVIDMMIQSEFWYRKEEDAQGELSEQVGAYFFNNFSTGVQTSVGYRFDAYKDLSKVNALTNRKVNNISYGTSIQGTYISSEFARIRSTVAHEFDREEGTTLSQDTRVTMQFVFIIGSHPAHDF